jgi:hypothetical protein
MNLPFAELPSISQRSRSILFCSERRGLRGILWTNIAGEKSGRAGRQAPPMRPSARDPAFAPAAATT